MLDRANENIEKLINEIIHHRRQVNRMYCCGLAQREDNNYVCCGDIDKPENSIELKCSDCKDLYWEMIEESMLEYYIVKED